LSGTFGVAGLAFLAPPLAAMALKFGPPNISHNGPRPPCSPFWPEARCLSLS
jgi:hypothetical protein